MIVCNYWYWGQNYWPYHKKSIVIDKSQYINIEENLDIDIVIDIDDGQWQLVKHNKTTKQNIGPKI